MPAITIARASGVKCERCWRIVPAVSSEPEWAGLCDRCQAPWLPERHVDNAIDEPVAAVEAGVATRPARYLEVWLPVLIVAIDQATKALIRATLPLHDSVTIISGLHGLHARAQQRRRVRHPERR